MTGGRIFFAAMCCSVIVSAPLSPATAAPSDWLPPGSVINSVSAPQEWLMKGARLEGQSLLGKLLFNSPSLLGEKAVRIGLSCNSCHPSGHVNTGFFMSGLSHKPGTVDVTNRFWQSGTEDNIFNPIQIPSLRGVRNSAPYGTVMVFPTLDAFTRHVIATEFGGPIIQPYELSALIAYMNLLKSTPKEGMPAHEKTSIATHLRLLQKPLETENWNKAQKVSLLIREELGRRSKLSIGETDTARNLVRALKSILKIAKNSSKSAKTALKQLITETE